MAPDCIIMLAKFAHEWMIITNIVCHLILGFDAFCAEEVLEWLLFLTTYGQLDSVFRLGCVYSPVDVGELMFSLTVLHAESDVKRTAGSHGSTYAGHCHRCDVIHADIGRWLGDEHECFVKAEQVTFVGLDRTLDTRLLVMTDEVARWSGDTLSTETPEDIGYNCSNGSFVVWLQLILVLVFQQVALHVEIKVDLFIALELHDEEWVSRLTLSEGRIQTNRDERVHVVWFWQNHKLLDRIELYLVVVCFTA